MPSRIGTMMPRARKRPSAVLSLNRYSLSAKAAMAPNSSTAAMEPMVTMRLLTK